MPSASLCFNVALFKKQTKRFWPLWSMYFLLHFMLLPMYLLMQSQTRFAKAEPLATTFQNYLTTMSTYGSLWINFVFCIFVAMAIWSYLYNSRSVSMIHALPLTRGTLFLTNYLTGLLFTLVPSVVVFLLALGIQAFAGAVTLKALLLWLLFQILFSVFFFSFATLFAFVTGHILILPVFYGIFSVLTQGIAMLLGGVFSSFVYGYTGNSLPVLDWFGDWLCPLNALQLRVHPFRPDVAGGVLVRPPLEVSGLGVLAMYAAVGLVLTLLAYLLYHRRRLELTGEVVTVSFLKPVFKYGVAVCTGLAFGMLFYQLFQEVFSQGIGSLLFFLLLWAAIGYYAAEMMLKKSFRVLRKGAPGVVALLLILTASMLAMEYDLTGYEKSIPNLEKVQSVEMVGFEHADIKDAEDIAAVIALHEALIKQKSDLEAQDNEHSRNMREGNENYYNTHYVHSVDLRYILKDGSLFSRSYNVPVTLELLAQKDSPAAQYEALLNHPKVRLESLFSVEMQAENLLEIRINVPDYAKRAPGKSQLSGVSFAADPYGKDATMTLTGEAAQRFYAAVREDIADGRLGHVFLGAGFDPEYPKTNCINSIYFAFRKDYNTRDYPEPTRGMRYNEYRDGNGKRVPYYEQSLDLQETATSAIAVLEQCGLVRGVHILTMEQGEKGGYEVDPDGYDKYGYQPSAMASDTTFVTEAGEPVVVSP